MKHSDSAKPQQVIIIMEIFCGGGGVNFINSCILNMCGGHVMSVTSTLLDLPKACKNTANEEDVISLDERR